MLPRFSKSNRSKFGVHARCPVCGDSKTNEYKARFNAYEYQGSILVNCYNCDYSKPLAVFMHDYYPDLYKEFIYRRYKERVESGEITPRKRERNELNYQTKPIPVLPTIEYSQRLDTLPPEHPVIKYVQNRMIPIEKYKRMYFTMNWQELVNSVNPDTYKNPKPEPRLVIPIYNKDFEIEAFQGRALRQVQDKKYITIKTCEEATKIYGLDTVNPEKLVLVLEGPIDTFFVDNAIAMTGGTLDLNVLPFKGKRAFVMDHEPRHKDTLSRMQNLIDAGEPIVMWDKSPWSSKDINDMIMKEGATKEEIYEYMTSNIVSGLAAKLRMKNYAKCIY